MGKLDDPSSIDCQAVKDDIEHAIFECDRWWTDRWLLEGTLGQELRPGMIVGIVMSDIDKWKLLSKFIN